MDEMKKIYICKNCKRPEYFGEFRWLSGSMICRNCYRGIWESENKQIYRWDDLDGKRPTMEEYKRQEEEDPDNPKYMPTLENNHNEEQY